MSPPSGGHGLEKLLPGVLPWWWVQREKNSEGTCLNKLEDPSFWRVGFWPNLWISVAATVSPAGHGGKGRRSASHGVRGFGAISFSVGFLSPELTSGFWCMAVEGRQSVKL